jgi:hypothetical protein
MEATRLLGCFTLNCWRVIVEDVEDCDCQFRRAERVM